MRRLQGLGLVMLAAGSLALAGDPATRPSNYSFEARFAPGILELTKENGTAWSSLRLGCSTSPCIFGVNESGGHASPAATAHASKPGPPSGVLIRETAEGRMTEFICSEPGCLFAATYADESREIVKLRFGESRVLATPVSLMVYVRR